ncbi:MAG: flagellar assembly protein FliH [Gammaproteobacteria bacterium]
MIPKEMQSAYQRWEMTSFGDERPSVVAARKPPEPEIQMPTQAEADAIRLAAHDQGYEAGLEEGRAAGLAEALEFGRQQAAQELEHLKAIAGTFGQAVTEADETIAGDVLDLALQLARGMLRTALNVKPELILPVVQEAIGYLPVFQQPAKIMLNPEDAELVMEHIGEDLTKSGWRVVQDAGIERGGCKVDTPHNQIDAQAAARWQRLTQSLGKNVEWLD